MKRGYYFTTVIDIIMRFLILHGITCLVISLVYGDKPAKYAIAASLIVTCAIFGIFRKVIESLYTDLFFILEIKLIFCFCLGGLKWIRKVRNYLMKQY
jgi:hypothetical protein